MTKQQFSQAFDLAKTTSEDLSLEDIGIFDGFGLEGFNPVFVTIRQVARLIRWQAGQMNGGWDAHNLDEIGQLGRKRFQII